MDECALINPEQHNREAGIDAESEQVWESLELN